MITLAIIGVVAAITIPGVIVNSQQTEYKTAFRKAVSSLNQAINAAKALSGETPYDNAYLYDYMRQNMNIMGGRAKSIKFSDATNDVFYTTDGIRYEFPRSYGSTSSGRQLWLYEGSLNGTHLYSRLNFLSSSHSDIVGVTGYCGSYGLAYNPDQTVEMPCIIAVDVNGDRKPSPTQALRFIGHDSVTLPYLTKSRDMESATLSGNAASFYKYPDPKGILMTDTFPVLITDKSAIPYGIIAQKAMYQAQK